MSTQRKRSDVWAHFKEVQVSSKNSEGMLRKVVKLECNSCKQCFTKSKDGTTSSLRRHIEVHCAGPNLQMVHSSMETGESISVNRIKRKRSDVWVHFEEVEVSSKNSEGIPQKVVKLKCKCCNRHFAKSKHGTTSSMKRHLESHPHLQKTNFGSEGTLGSEVSENDTSTELQEGTKRRRSDVWSQFEEAVVTEKKQDGSILKVKKVRCNKCKKLFTKSEDSGTGTGTWKRHQTCAISNGQKSLLDYCMPSSK